MNKYISLIMLNIREILYRFCAAVIVACLINTGIYLYASKTDIYVLLSSNGLYYAFVLDLLLVICAIAWRRGKSTLTITRLRVDEFEEFVCNSIACGVFLLIAYCLEVIKVTAFLYLFSKEYVTVNAWTNIMLWFYGNNFLHGLLPLAHIAVVLRNIIAFIGMSIAVGISPIQKRYRKLKSVYYFVLLIALWNPISIESSAIACVEIFVCIVGIFLIISNAKQIRNERSSI